MHSIILIAHNIRSAHNVGSLLRTADGLGIDAVWLTGYTPYPSGGPKDQRLPHTAQKTDRQIAKTALGAEKSIKWQHQSDIFVAMSSFKQDGYQIVGLEQSAKAIKLPDFTPPNKLAIVVGREVDGIESEVLVQCNQLVEIPMFGQKESYNVAQAAAMALYHCRFANSLRT